MNKSPNKNNRASEIKEIISRVECTKNITCYESNIENLYKAVDIGLKLFLVCLEESPQACPFSLSFGKEYYCKCPVRIYIAKESKK